MDLGSGVTRVFVLLLFLYSGFWAFVTGFSSWSSRGQLLGSHYSVLRELDFRLRHKLYTPPT
jgi:hypothetical protein